MAALTFADLQPKPEMPVPDSGTLDLSSLDPIAPVLQPAQPQPGIVDYARKLGGALSGAVDRSTHDQLRLANQYGGAVQELNKQIAATPSTLPAELKIGVEQAKQGYLQTAQSVLERAKPVFGAMVANPGAMSNLAGVYGAGIQQGPALTQAQGEKQVGAAASAIRQKIAESAKRTAELTPEDRSIVSRFAGGALGAALELPKYMALVASGPVGLMLGFGGISALDTSTSPATGEFTGAKETIKGGLYGAAQGAILGKAFSIPGLAKKMAAAGAGGSVLAYKRTWDPDEAMMAGALNALFVAQPSMRLRFMGMTKRAQRAFGKKLYLSMVRSEVKRFIQEHPDKADQVTRALAETEATAKGDEKSGEPAPTQPESIAGAAAAAGETQGPPPIEIAASMPAGSVPGTRASRVLTAFGDSYPVFYAAVEARALKASHLPGSFAPNPAYPEGVNPRNYQATRTSQQKVEQIAMNPQVDVLHSDTPTPIDGPPMVTPDGTALGGNGRVIALQTVYARGGENAAMVRDSVRRDAARFGIDPASVAGMEQPVIVRVFKEPPTTPEEMNVVAENLNAAMTESSNRAGTGVANARKLSNETLSHFGALVERHSGEKGLATVREAIRADTQLPGLLIQDGVFPSNEAGRYVDAKTGALTPDGMQLVEDAVLGRAVGDAHLVQAMRSSVRDKVLRAAPAAVRIAERNPEFGQAFGQVARILNDLAEHGMSVDGYLRQTSLLGENELQKDPRLAGLARLVSESNANQLRKYFGSLLDTATGKEMFGTADVLERARELADQLLAENKADAEKKAEKKKGKKLKKPKWGDTLAAEAPAEGTVITLGSVAPELPAGRGAAPPEKPGQNNPVHLETIADRPNTEPLMPGEQILAPRTIIQRFAERLGHPFYTGHMGSRPKNWMGFHRPGTKETRVRLPNNIEYVAHEAAHLIESDYPEIALRIHADHALAEELRTFRYATKRNKTKEGWAEFLRGWLTQPEETIPNGPRATAMLEDVMRRNPDLGEALREMQMHMSRYHRMPASQRAMALIGQAMPAAGYYPRGIRNLKWWTYQRIFDWGAAAMRQEYKMHGKLLSAEKSPWKFLAIVRRAAFITAESLKEGHPVLHPDGSIRFAGQENALFPLLAKYHENNSLERFMAYLVGRRAQVMMDRGKERLFSQKQIDGLVSLGEDNPQWEADAEKFQKIEHGYLDFARDAQLLSPESVEAMKQYFHVALFRDVERSYSGNAKAASMKPVKGAHGGVEAIRDPLENTIMNMNNLVSLSLKNMWKHRIWDMARMPGGADLMAEIPPDARKQAISTEEVKKTWAELSGYDLKDERIKAMVDELWKDMPGVMSMWTFGHAPTDKNTMILMSEGKPKYFMVGDPELMRTVAAVDHGLPSGGLLSKFRVFQQYTVTRDPVFLARAIFRDQPEAWATGRGGFSPVIDTYRGVREIMRDSEDYQMLKANGLGMGGLISGEGARRELKRLVVRDTGGRAVMMNNARHMKALIDDISEGVEMAARVGAGMRGLKQGDNPMEAAFKGIDITTDFTMRGDAALLQPLFNNVLFLRAGLSGMYHAKIALTDPAIRNRVWRRVGALTLLSAINQLHNDSNPLYDGLSPAIKDTYTFGLLPKTYYMKLMLSGQPFASTDELGRQYREGTEEEQRAAYEELGRRYHIVMGPKPWEIGSIMRLGEIGASYFTGHMSNPDAAKDVANTILRNFHLGVVPVGYDAALESLTNKYGFSGTPITPQSMVEGVRPPERWTARTPIAARKIGEFTGGSPTEIDHWLNATFHAGARWGMRLTDHLLFGDEVVPSPSPLVMSWHRDPAQSNEPVRGFYDTIYTADQYFGSFNAKAKQEGRGMADYIGQDLPELLLTPESDFTPGPVTYLQENAGQISTSMRMRGAKRAIEGLRSVRQSVVRMKHLSDVQLAAETLSESLEYPEFLAGLKHSGVWNHKGALKAAIVDETKKAQSRAAIRAQRAPALLEGVQ